MKRINAIIISFCTTMAIAELSAPGQLVFGFPFVSESFSLFSKVPGSFSKIKTTLHTDIAAAYNNATLDDVQSSQVPNTDQPCQRLTFSDLDAAMASTKVTRAEFEQILGKSNCVNGAEVIYDNGTITLKVIYKGENIDAIHSSTSGTGSNGVSNTDVGSV